MCLKWQSICLAFIFSLSKFFLSLCQGLCYSLERIFLFIYHVDSHSEGGDNLHIGIPAKKERNKDPLLRMTENNFSSEDSSV